MQDLPTGGFANHDLGRWRRQPAGRSDRHRTHGLGWLDDWLGGNELAIGLCFIALIAISYVVAAHTGQGLAERAAAAPPTE